MSCIETTSPPAIGVIETDAFCEGCGFNLHSQAVWRDERLAIAVCRCPECGKHSAAGVRTTSTNAWARRLALVGLLVWIALGLAFVAGSFGLFAAMHAASIGTATFTRNETVDGHALQSVWITVPNGVNKLGWARLDDPAKTPLPPEAIVNRTTLAPFLGGPVKNDGGYIQYDPPLIEIFWLCALFGTGTFATGCVVACFTWYWRRGRAFIWLVVPLLAMGLILSLKYSSQSGIFPTPARREGDGLIIATFVAVLLAQLLISTAGLLLGRRIGRLILNMFVPPKSRQLFAFLWIRDGLTMPTR